MVQLLIQKHLANTGQSSRREGEKLVREGKVYVNGVRATPGQMIDPKKDSVELKDVSQVKMTVMIYKPRGVVCSENTAEGKTVAQAFPQFASLNYVGRLDKDSEGLLLLSNDGLITRLITGEDDSVEKEYVVETREKVLGGMMTKMEKGIKLDGEKTKTLPCKATIINPNCYRIILTEGRKHQVRRMADACGLTVESLKRIRIGKLRLGSMQSGRFKILSPDDIALLKA
jgi:23S rRNA pseudouridine2604 synthase